MPYRETLCKKLTLKKFLQVKNILKVKSSQDSGIALKIHHIKITTSRINPPKTFFLLKSFKL